jgi:trans-aconitate methyltransferase
MTFKNPHYSHEHSLEILNLLYGYDSFLDSLKVICDMGCGSALDAQWWATLETRDDPPEPRGYRVYAVDRDFERVEPDLKATPGIRWIAQDFNKVELPERIDLLWCHDAFQYSVNPLQTLAQWNSQMNTDGMLVMSLPQDINYIYNKLQFKTRNYSYFNYSIPNLIYMLAVNGFDCRDAYFYKNMQSNWINVAVYKSGEPMDPASTSLFDLADKGLFNDSMVGSINSHGYLRQEDIIFTWLDKDFYQAGT